MKKGGKIALTVFNFIAVIGVFLYGLAFIFVGLFAEALAAVFVGVASGGQAQVNDSEIIRIFTTPALLLMATSIVALVATILLIVSFKKPVKGLQIALGVSYGLCAILVIVAIVLLLVKMTFDQGSIAGIIAIIVVALLHVALYVLSALFGGFKPAFKKEAAPSVE